MDPTQRFANRVEDYARYRPGYPPQVLDTLRRECGLTAQSLIADVGCGTGILSQLFCEAGNWVYGVEPNASMLQAARESLRGYPKFTAVHAPAEATTLPIAAVDLVTAAQAFHWFDAKETRREFARILKPGGWVVLLWNERRMGATPFMVAYEHLLVRFGVDYHKVKPLWNKNALPEFFGAAGFRKAVFDNPQILDRAGLTGRILSASYMPHRGHPSFPPMLGAIDNLFDDCQKDGQLRMEQETMMFYGKLVLST
ncbi:MAG: class I SAM-dependent methyltransferase [Acidobacteriia bacterium]|nr:class I SAM-dependent methyltransferase [Terriglobia bacterium]